MSKIFSKFALAAGMVLAMAFTFSCSGDDGGTDEPSSSSAENPSVPSSSSIPSSSSTGGGGNPSSSSVGSQNGVVYGEPVNYEGDIYQTVVIGTQTWFAKNLNYDVEGSRCYDDDPANCVKYGRLYDWSLAMTLPSSCATNSCAEQIQAKHQGICPSGWHIPSNEDWDKLYRFADGSTDTESPYHSPTAGKHLKSVTGWNPYEGIENLDTYGFSALPGGEGGLSNGNFLNVGSRGFWWSASEYESYGYNAYFRTMNYYSGEPAYWGNGGKSFLFSVRCLQD